MTEQFETLLKRMGDIATAVNAFTSDVVQAEAFAALVATFHGAGVPKALAKGEHQQSTRSTTETAEAPVANGTGAPARKRRDGTTTARADFTMVRDLDLRPKGKVAFADFIAEKQPTTNQDRIAVVVYYLGQVLELPAVSEDHIGTVFRVTPGWREPSPLRTAINMTANRKATINSTNHANITITPQGRNFVEIDLPPKATPKK